MLNRQVMEIKMDNIERCVPCFIEQIIDKLDKLALSQDQRQQLIELTIEESKEILNGRSTPQVMMEVVQEINKLTAGQDPYRRFKEKSTQAALEILPRVEAKVSRAKNPFRTAVKVVVAANVIDLVTLDEKDLGGVVNQLVSGVRENFAIDQISELKKAIEAAAQVFYIGDNAGEAVFDRLLLRRINCDQLYYGVRGKPVLNDATPRDAVASGIEDEGARIISSGVPSPGAILSVASARFKKIFRKSDLVIAKGQGNFEALQELSRPVFHLFKIKCQLVADQVQAPGDSFVVWRREP